MEISNMMLLVDEIRHGQGGIQIEILVLLLRFQDSVSSFSKLFMSKFLKLS